ncbi:hypothetical protein FS837_011357 [Tulasnella sp. UAMH 9824]|nr:hypothetical protein FS837_011357 [Tulasnella sp. UAMH 9824]
MADTTAFAPQFMDEQNLEKARAILNRVSHYRVEPSRIKMTDAAPHHKGGQGVVTIGTLSLPEAAKIFVSELKAAGEMSLEEY